MSGKLAVPAPARDLYTTAWFQKARAYAEAVGDRWFILSAKHGLLHPDVLVAPYDETLNAMPHGARVTWAERVARQIRVSEPAPARVVILAGNRYREHLMWLLQRAGHTVEVPMTGLGIGRQLRWMLDHTPSTQGSLSC